MSISTILIVAAAVLLILLVLKIIGKTFGLLLLIGAAIVAWVYFTHGHSFNL